MQCSLQLLVNLYIDIPVLFSGPHTGLHMAIPWVDPCHSAATVEHSSSYLTYYTSIERQLNKLKGQNFSCTAHKFKKDFF